jgi:hypothetical protein
MQDSGVPAKFTTIFAADAGGSYIRAIPATTVDPNAASYALGFPPNVFVPTDSGGDAPDGRDFNGLFKQLSAWAQWQAAGGPVVYDATFQTDIGGYASGAIITSGTTPGKLWMSTADNNTSDPDTGGANWTGWVFGSSAAAVTSLTAGLGLSGGTITSTGTIALLQASTGQLGGVKVDGTTITISGSGVISAVQSIGTVTSVGLVSPSFLTSSGGPITGSGNLTLALATQSANLVFAGPASGAAAAPTFRSIAAADLPNATSGQKGAVQVDGSTVSMTGQILSANLATSSAPGIVKPDGTSITISGGVISSTASGYVLPAATTSVLGGVQPDGTSILVSAGVISASTVFNGTASTPAAQFVNALEVADIIGSAPASTYNLYVASGAVQYHTSNATNNWTINFAWSSGTTMNAALGTGNVATVTHIVTQGSGTYYANAFQIDGVPVTPKWLSANAPGAGHASSLDVYTYSIIKRGSGAYTVLASLTQYA